MCHIVACILLSCSLFMLPVQDINNLNKQTITSMTLRLCKLGFDFVNGLGYI